MEEQFIDKVARLLDDIEGESGSAADRHSSGEPLQDSFVEMATKLLEVRDAANHFREIADQLHVKETDGSHTAAGAFETAAFYIELVLSDKHPDEAGRTA